MSGRQVFRAAGEQLGSTAFEQGEKLVRREKSRPLQLVEAAVRGRDSESPAAFYHLHPFHQDPRIIEPPSWHDVHSLALMKGTCGTQLVGIIFDGRGKWTFDITGDLEDRLRSQEQSAGDYARSHGYGSGPAVARFDQEYPLIAWNENLSNGVPREERIRAFIDSARHLGVVITYSPR